MPFVDLGRKYALIDGDTAFLATGVGPVAAAFGLAHFLEDCRPDAIFAVGTAGVIATDPFKIGDVVEARLVATSSGLEEAYTPKAQRAVITLQPPPSATQAASVYCPQEITRDEALRARLATAGHDVEHLEAFAFAFVAKKFKIPLRIFLGLTNIVGPHAHAEWLKNAKIAVKRASQAAKRHLG